MPAVKREGEPVKQWRKVAWALCIIRRCINTRWAEPRRSAKDTKRRKILIEVYETEWRYVDALKTLDAVYVRPLMAILDAPSLAVLFGNVDDIRIEHEKLLVDITPLRTAFDGKNPGIDVYVAFAQAFISRMDKLSSIYTKFIPTHAGINVELERLKRERKPFRRFLAEALFDPLAKSREVEDFMVQPVQRISGYKLFFQRVLGYLPEETFRPARAAFAELLDRVQEMGKLLDAGKRGDQDSEARLLEIMETMQGLPRNLVIFKGGRDVVMADVELREVDDRTGKKGDLLTCDVTSDLLLIGRRGVFRRWQFVDAIPIVQVKFIQCRGGWENVFAIRSDTHEYCVRVEKVEMTPLFRAAVEETRKQCERQVRTQMRAGREWMAEKMAALASLYTEPRKLRTRAEALDSLK